MICEEHYVNKEHDKIKHNIKKYNIKKYSAKQTKKEDVNTGFIYNPLHQFCVSLLVIENEDVKSNLLQTHPNLRFHCDTTERDRMDLLTPDVLRSLTAPIAYVYKKTKKTYIFMIVSKTLSVRS